MTMTALKKSLYRTDSELQSFDWNFTGVAAGRENSKSYVTKIIQRSVYIIFCALLNVSSPWTINYIKICWKPTMLRIDLTDLRRSTLGHCYNRQGRLLQPGLQPLDRLLLPKFVLSLCRHLQWAVQQAWWVETLTNVQWCLKVYHANGGWMFCCFYLLVL